MPDPTRQTISATQAPALWNVSPWVTRWMLYKLFADGVDIDGEADGRMRWGLKMQPLLLEQAAADLRFEVKPDEQYVRRGQLGCTRDAIVTCPDRGPGALECKCVFDYGTWMADWGGGRFVPRHYEIQLQQQMFVGDGDGAAPYQWGVVGAWVAGDMYYFERKPIEDLWTTLEIEAARFFNDVKAGREPEPFGAPIEIPWLTKLFPCDRGKLLDLMADPDGDDAAELMRQYKAAKDQESASRRTAEAARAKILALAKDAEEIALPAGIRVSIKDSKRAATTVKASVSKRINVHIPDDQMTTIAPDHLMAG